MTQAQVVRCLVFKAVQLFSLSGKVPMFGRSNDSPVHFILLNVMVVVISVIFAQGRVSAAEQQAATVAEAVKAIDLSKFPTLIGAEEVGTLTVAQLSYLAEGECKAAFEFQRGHAKSRW